MTGRAVPVSLVLVASLALGGCAEELLMESKAGTPGEVSFSLGDAAGGTALQETDRHIFVFHREGPPPARVLRDVSVAGGTVDRVHDAVGVAVVEGLTDDRAEAIARGTAIVERDVMIQWISPPDAGGMRRTTLEGVGEARAHDPAAAFFFPFQWNMRVIWADQAWGAGFQGDPVVRVAILDSGLDPFHIDLAGRIDVERSRAFVASLNGAGPDWGDDNFHGTHVGGTVVTNGLGTSGVAPHVTLIAVKVLNVVGAGTVDWLIAGILHAVSGSRRSAWRLPGATSESRAIRSRTWSWLPAAACPSSCPW
jgi:subtilisin family serine protease